MATISRETLAVIRARLTELESEKAELEQLLASYAYPVLTLPNEITGLIFTHYVPPYPECPPFSGSGSPTTLSQVCHSWRQIALSMSSLWCAIQYGESTQAAAVSCWLSRTGDLPLSLQAVYDGSPPEDVETILLGCSGRWEHVQLRSVNLCRSLSLGPGDNLSTPKMRHLELHIYDTDSEPFKNAPNLRTAIIWDTFDCPRGLLPWSQLTGLILVCLTVEQTVEIVSQTPSLRYCEVMLDREYPAVPPPDISLPHLETLVLSRYSDADVRMPGEFLLNLVTPALRHLRITDPMLRPDPAARLLQFVNKAGCRLEDVTILGHRSMSRESYDLWGRRQRYLSGFTPKVLFEERENEWFQDDVSQRSRERLLELSFREPE